MTISTVSFREVMNRLCDQDQPFPAKYLQYFSDLNGDQEFLFANTWKVIPVTRKMSLLDDLDELNEHDTLMDFTSVGKIALSDDDEHVREAALRLLWECEDKPFIQTALDLIDKDSSALVRASAASVMGHYILMGETDKLPTKISNCIIDRLLAAYRNDIDKLVKRRALESLGYSSREEIKPLISQAASDKDPDWLASSLYAMGRSADPSWAEIIKGNLKHEETSVREEAVRAAGALELQDTRDPLITLVEQEDDDDVRAAAIWSLSQIGGEGVREVIMSQIESAEDDDYSDFLENALDNLNFTEELAQFNLLDINSEDKES